MKTREEITAYIGLVQRALEREERKFKTIKGDFTKEILSKSLQEKFQTQINTLKYVLND
jgi:hypothetical protein